MGEAILARVIVAVAPVDDKSGIIENMHIDWKSKIIQQIIAWILLSGLILFILTRIKWFAEMPAAYLGTLVALTSGLLVYWLFRNVYG